MTFDIGDTIKIIKDFEDFGKGLGGVIRSHQFLPGVNLHRYYVEFTNPINGIPGWWIHCKDPNDYFECIGRPVLGFTSDVVPFNGEKEMNKMSYHPGMPIDDYVKLLVENVTDKNQLKWLKTFQNCVLPQDVKEVIEEALTVVLNKNKFDEWGINDHFEKGLTNSILLYGPPGTGKTMISESIAAILGKNLMKLDSGTVLSQIPGQAERNMKKAFEEATAKNCVLMLDECDSLLSSREFVGTILSAQINTLLTEIERFTGVVVLTTNRLDRLDEALSRRIVAKIKLDLPDKETRKIIWKKLLPPSMPICDKIDWDILAQTEIAGGDIKNAIILAARKAITRNEDKVTMDHFAGALKIASGTKFIDHSARMDGHTMTASEKTFINRLITNTKGQETWKS